MFSRLATLGLFGAALALGLGTARPAQAQGCASCGTGSCGTSSCGGHCGFGSNLHCPPPLVHCMERPPHIKWKCVCPRPVCDPCTLEHYGYYQTCWCPWPYPPDLRHCPCIGEHPALPYLVQPPVATDPIAPKRETMPKGPEPRVMLLIEEPRVLPTAALERQAPRVEVISVIP
jgi:hypothetical protein